MKLKTNVKIPESIVSARGDGIYSSSPSKWDKGRDSQFSMQEKDLSERGDLNVGFCFFGVIYTGNHPTHAPKQPRAMVQSRGQRGLACMVFTFLTVEAPSSQLDDSILGALTCYGTLNIWDCVLMYSLSTFGFFFPVR